MNINKIDSNINKSIVELFEEEEFNEDQELRKKFAELYEGNSWQRITLRTKATMIGIALSTLPLLLVGTSSYIGAGSLITQQTYQIEQTRSKNLASKLNRFMFDRYADSQVLAKQPIWADSKYSTTVSKLEKETLLNHYVTQYGIYDSITIFDVNGNTVAQSKGISILHRAQVRQALIQQILKTGKPVITEPKIVKGGGEQAVIVASPIRELTTGNIIGILKMTVPVKSIAKSIKEFQEEGKDFYVISPQHQVFISSNDDNADIKVLEHKELGKLVNNNKSGTGKLLNANDRQEYLFGYSPLENVEGMPSLNWSALALTREDVAFSPQLKLLWAILGGAGVTACLAIALAVYLASLATKPITRAAKTVQKIGQGDFDQRLEVEGNDEIAILSHNINEMTDQIEDLLKSLDDSRRKAELFAAIARCQTTTEMAQPLEEILGSVREKLLADRVVVYRFLPTGNGHIVGESVGQQWPRSYGDHDSVNDPCIPEDVMKAYAKGQVVTNSNVMTMDYHPDHRQLLERLRVKANLIVPIVQNKTLLGLLIAHHCNKCHDWQQWEIDYMLEISTELGISLSGYRISEERQLEAQKQRERAEQEANSNMQRQQRLFKLLSDVEGASAGDLTVRAEIDESEIGIVGDFFNAIIENLMLQSN